MVSNSSNHARDEFELSAYELQRTVHEVITDDTEIAVPLEALHEDFMCPICLDLLSKTMATKCLHRFCSECIVTALRSGNKECPTCRQKLKSKRCLRPDTNFDMMITLLFPNRVKYNTIRSQMMENLKLSQSQDNMVKSKLKDYKNKKNTVSYKTKKKRGARRTKNRSSNTSAPSTSTQVDENVTESTVQINGTKKKKIMGLASTTVNSNIIECDGAFNSMSLNDMELVLKPHPKNMQDINQLKKDSNETGLRYIKVPPVATVEHVSNYLTMRLNLELGKELGNSDLKVLIYISQTTDQYVLLDNNLTLQNVQEKFWNGKKEKPMDIFYSYN